ncbi:MAG: FAD-dependent oxidoreductase, partial [Pseudomonadota bacterium]
MSGDPGDSGAFDFDLYVIGGGSGGVRAARISAGHGARVGLAEEHRFGGTCVIRGCVPKKLMVYASAFSETFEDAEGFGWSVGDSAFDWSRFIAAKDKEIARLEGLYRKGLEGAGVAPHEGRAVVAGPHSVRLLGPDGAAREVTAKHILVAVGGRPFVPDFPGAEHAITSNDIFHLETQPRRILIAGGGYIACEFAGIMNGLGTETELIYRSGEILRGFDDDVRPLVRREMQKKGVKVRLNEIIDALEKGPDGLRVSFSGGDSGVYDQVLFATGRAPNTAGLGLESAGLALGASGEIPVDAYSQSAVPSIYAVGDVTNRVNLTPVAIREGHAFADTVFAARPTMVDHAQIPTAVFTQPEIGTVGLTEAEARA